MTALDRPAQYDEPRATLDAHRGGAEAAPPAKSHAGGGHAGPVTLDRPAAWDEQRATLDAHAGAHDAVAEAAPHAPASHATAGDAGRAGPVTLDRPAAWDEQRATLDAHDHPAVAADRPIAPSLPEVATSGHRAPTLDRPAEWDEHRDTLPIQTKAAGPAAVAAADPHAVAATGVASASAPLPHLDVIQRSFGSHDVSHVRASIGGAAAAASAALGAEAYATGDRVAFASSPSLHTAAHEAAHVVQQRAGVHLKGGLGEAGDTYEQHADAVADAVVRGDSAAPLLLGMLASSASADAALLQRKGSGSSSVELARQSLGFAQLSFDQAEGARASAAAAEAFVLGATEQLETAARFLGDVTELSSGLALAADETFAVALRVVESTARASVASKKLRASMRAVKGALTALGWVAPNSKAEAALRGSVASGISTTNGAHAAMSAARDEPTSNHDRDPHVGDLMPAPAGVESDASAITADELADAKAGISSIHPEQWVCEAETADASDCSLDHETRRALIAEIGFRASLIATKWSDALVEAKVAALLNKPSQWGALQEIAFLVLADLAGGEVLPALESINAIPRRLPANLHLHVARLLNYPQAVLKAVSIVSKVGKNEAKSFANKNIVGAEEAEFLGTVADIPAHWAQQLTTMAPRLLDDAGLVTLAAMLDERFHRAAAYQQQVAVLVSRWRHEVGEIGTPAIPMLQQGPLRQVVWIEHGSERRLAACLVKSYRNEQSTTPAERNRVYWEFTFVEWVSEDLVDSAVAKQQAMFGEVPTYSRDEPNKTMESPLLGGM
ncbi:MAG: DUF4157 domain-containing protein [Kofleriaceae bacterium]|nr:DUF4157 domain-containing protein [Kofleriaceae bacterium]